MHGQAVIAGTRVPISVILDCLAAGMTAEEITAEYPTVTIAGVRAAAAYGAALAREELLPLHSPCRSHGEVQARREPARLLYRDLDQCRSCHPPASWVQVEGFSAMSMGPPGRHGLSALGAVLSRLQ
jgi:uncharacterized protein (DUF433 family)